MSSTVYAIIASSESKDTWKFYELSSYRFIKPLSTPFPLFCETEQTKQRIEVIKDLIQYNIPTVIEGETGSGKTYTVEQYCIRAQLPLLRMNLSGVTTIEELIGDTVVNNDGKTVFMRGPLSEAFSCGKILLLDELSLASDLLLEDLSSILNQETLCCSMTMKIHRHPFFRVVATQVTPHEELSVYDDSFCIVSSSSFPAICDEEIKMMITSLFYDETVSSRVVGIHTKDHSIRDCLRVKAMITSGQNLSLPNPLETALSVAYNQPFDSPEPSYPESIINPAFWSGTYSRIRLALEGGCNVLLVGNTEYDARKICHCYLNQMNQSAAFYSCSSVSSLDSLLGAYGVDKMEPTPHFIPSSLMSAIQNGGLFVLQSIHLMKPALIERLNPLLEVNPFENTILRFDENRDTPLVSLNESFRLIATVSIDGLKSLSPALRSRFLEILVEEDCPVLPAKELNWNIIDENAGVDREQRKTIERLLNYSNGDLVMKNNLRIIMVFYRFQLLSLYPSL